MRFHHTAAAIRPTLAGQGFSLVEVTLALGILAFCMIPLLGLLPTGLNAQQGAQERARATTTLNMLAMAVRSARFVSQSNGMATYQLPAYFANSATPLSFTVGDPTAIAPCVYQILEDGTIRPSSDTTTPTRETIYVQIIPSSSAAPTGTVSVYAVVVWPALPTDSSSTSLAALTNRQGSVESFITYVPSH